MNADPAPPTVLYHSAEVEARLMDRFGVGQSFFWHGLHRGLVYLANLTEHDPVATKGMGVWGAMVRGLGETGKPLKWSKRERNLLPLLVHPEGKLAISVQSGDANTGLRPQRRPSPRNRCPIEGDTRKMTRKLIEDNSALIGRQGHFSQMTDEWESPSLLTYFLLHWIDPDFEHVQAEVSLAAHLGKDGFVDTWQERLILTAPEGQSLTVEGDELDIDIDIEPKRSALG